MQKLKAISNSISLESIREFFFVALGIDVVWSVNSMMQCNWIGIVATLVLLIGIFIVLVILGGKIRKEQEKRDKQRDEALVTIINKVMERLITKQTEMIRRVLQSSERQNGDKTTDTKSEE